MNDNKRGFGRIALYAGVIGAMVVSILPAGAGSVAAQGTCRNINKIDVCGRFLEVWNKPGSEQSNVYVNGLPITPKRAEISTTDGKTYQTQWFERARYEEHPENKAPYDVLLGLLGNTSKAEGRGGVDPATGRVRNAADAAFVKVAKPGDTSATKVWFTETGHIVSGKILEYWNKYGGLQQFGFPISEQFKEVSEQDGKTYDVQYFERNRFELHPEKAAPYEVELGLLGAEQHEATPIAASALPIAPKAGETTTAKTTLVAGSQQEPADLTIYNNAAITSRILRFINRSLTYRDENSAVFPELAWYVPTLENGGAYYVGLGDDKHLVVKYKLRQGIKWSDGSEVTSNDGVFTYKLAMNPDAPVLSRSEEQKLENVDNPDKYTIIYNFRSLKQLTAYYNSIPDKENYAFLNTFIKAKKPAGSLTYAEIGAAQGAWQPGRALANVPPASIRTAAFATTPIGSGPWKVQTWNKKQEMVLIPNENYNLTAKPLIQTIRIKFITDVNQLIAQVKTKELDLVFSEAFNAPPADKAGIEAAGAKISSRPATTWEHMDFYFEYGPFKEKPVRQAIMQGVNRKRISDVVYSGTAGVMNTVVPPLAFHSLENADHAKNFPAVAAKYKLPNNDYNVASANALLDGAGWVRGADGIRAKGGVKLSFEYGTTTQAVRQQIQALVSADLKVIGVDAVTKNYGADVFFAGDNTDPRANGTTKLQEFAYVGSVDSDYSSWTCDQRYNPQTTAGVNNQQYCNPELDAANGEYGASASRAEIAEASAKAQVILANDVAVVPLVQRANIEIVSNALQNHKETNSQYPSTYNAAQWWFK